MTDDEQELLSRCFERDQAAWSEFVQRYAGLIYHTIKRTSALRRAETPQDFVDDLFQDIFLSLVKDDFAELRRFRGDHGCTLASWLRMIAARRTIDYLRTAKFPAELLEEPLENHPVETQERLLDNEQSQLLAKVIEDLPSHEKILYRSILPRRSFRQRRGSHPPVVRRRGLHPEKPHPGQAPRKTTESWLAVRNHRLLRLFK